MRTGPSPQCFQPFTLPINASAGKKYRLDRQYRYAQSRPCRGVLKLRKAGRVISFYTPKAIALYWHAPCTNPVHEDDDANTPTPFNDARDRDGGGAFHFRLARLRSD